MKEKEGGLHQAKVELKAAQMNWEKEKMRGKSGEKGKGLERGGGEENNAKEDEEEEENSLAFLAFRVQGGALAFFPPFLSSLSGFKGSGRVQGQGLW